MSAPRSPRGSVAECTGMVQSTSASREQKRGAPRRSTRHSLVRRIFGAAANVGTIVVCVLWVSPYLWMVLSAFKTELDIVALPPRLLFVPTLTHFKSLIEDYGVLPSIWNSVIVVLMATTLAVAVGALAAYGLGRYRFRGKDAIALDILSIRMIPPIASAIPIYLLSLRTGLYNTHMVLALVGAVFNVPLVVWVLRVFVEEMPYSIEESAMMDGCSRIQVLTRITLPLILPGIAAVTILTAIFVWNEFLFATLLSGAEVKTLPPIIAESIHTRSVAWGVAAAGGTLMSLPLVIPLLMVQRYLVRGLTFGAVKG